MRKKKINHFKLYSQIVVGIFAVFFAFMMFYFYLGGTKTDINKYCYDYKEIFTEEQEKSIQEQLFQDSNQYNRVCIISDDSHQYDNHQRALRLQEKRGQYVQPYVQQDQHDSGIR